MSRPLTFVLGSLLTLGLCASVHAQNSQSLGDLARQLRKDKPASSSGKVFTNEDLGADKNLAAGKGNDSLGFSVPSSDAQALSDPISLQKALAGIDKADAEIKELDSMDRGTLIKVALQGQSTAFPGRRAWEDKLWAAKQNYVQQGKEFVRNSRQILAEAQSLRDSQGGQKMKPDDPKVQEFVADLRKFLEEALRADSAFQAVIFEGWDLAKQSSSPAAAPAQP